MLQPPRRRWWPVALLGLCLSALLATVMVWSPNPFPAWTRGRVAGIVVGGTALPFKPVLGASGEVRVPLPALQMLDNAVRWDAATHSVLVTTANQYLRLPTKSLTAFVNLKPVELRFPVSLADGVVEVPLDPVLRLLPLRARYVRETGILVLDRTDQPLSTARVVRGTRVRTRPTRHARWIADLAAGAEVAVFGREGAWQSVRMEDGRLGWARAADLTAASITRPAVELPQWRPPARKGRIDLTWDPESSWQAFGKATAPSGVNVVSPVWFSLDPAGNWRNRGDVRYSDAAHRRNVAVWALADNGFDPARTHAALATADSREQLIRQLLIDAEVYRLDGINLDFENVALADGPLFTEFVRELVPLAHERGLVVSVDVTIRSQSERWSGFYERAALAKSADYLVLMAYDEHTGNSTGPGAVASLPWVEWGLRDLLRVAPPERVILGIPLYTRVWSRELWEAQWTVKAITLPVQDRLAAEAGVRPIWDAQAAQSLLAYNRGPERVQIWLEDDTTLRQRVALARRWQLAGVATWRWGFERKDTWQAIADALRSP